MKKIAIINNDADFLTAMEALLEETGGYQAEIIHEGNTAYHLIKKNPPDLIILDIRMEEPETGWKVLDLLTLDPITSTLPVIICTASLIRPEKQKWLEEHGIKILLKPFDIHDLLVLLKSLLKPPRKSKGFLKELEKN